MPMSKSMFKSKTFWLNALSLGLTLASPSIQHAVSTHPVEGTAILTLANGILRRYTDGAVHVVTPREQEQP